MIDQIAQPDTLSVAPITATDFGLKNTSSGRRIGVGLSKR
jgi:hypothetical protein